MVMGFIMLVVSDTLYAHVGIEAALIPAFHRHELKATWCGRLIILWRIVFGITGQTMFWGGMFSWQANSCV
jgi:hypothetical protein